jgi:hypothetical protein
MSEIRNDYRILVGTLKWKNNFENAGVEGRIILVLNFIFRYEAVTLIKLYYNTVKWEAAVNIVMTFRVPLKQESFNTPVK